MRPLLNRRLLAFAVLLVWAAVLTAHVRREYFKPLALRLEEGARSIPPGTYFYIVRMDGRAIGLASSRLDTVPDGFELVDVINLDVPALDSVHSASVRTTAGLGPSLELRSFGFELDSEIGRFSATGQVTGDTALSVEIRSAGSTQTATLPRPPGTVVASSLPLRIAAAGELEVGRSFTVRLLDPSVLATREVEVSVVAHDTMVVPTDSVVQRAGEWVSAAQDTVPVWKLEESYGGVQVASWVDSNGHLVRAESALGFTLERTAYEIARDAWQAGRAAPGDGGYGTVIESTAISADADLGGAGELDRLAVLLEGVDLEGFDLDGGRQRLRGDTLSVLREDPSLFTRGYALPYTGGGEPATELEATPFVQSEDPAIQRMAERIAGGEKDAAIVARRLNEWVYAFVEKNVTLSIPSAVEVLRAGEGDCNEHTVLYVALARALGLPARTAVGLVHLDGRFYYHAWPEVWLGEAWVAVDPTLGQFPADASHLRFLTGGLARQVELVRLIGRLDLQILRI